MQKLAASKQKWKRRVVLLLGVVANVVVVVKTYYVAPV